MWRSRTVRELMRQHAQELQRRDEYVQTLLDRIQQPDRVPTWREVATVAELPVTVPNDWIPDPDQLP